ncbi:MAG TPA: ABC transporter substrate-binding protein [Candidatus Baltobacteraceae bacterium]|nr:ABC transporter substrate-binding protein [Candidatus Baltobacteraceae bacterium]
MSKRNTWFGTAIIAVIALTLTLGIPSGAQSVPGVTPTQILLGGTHPYSGPAAGYAPIGKGILAYFAYVNDHGGVYGRKIVYEDKDDAYNPPQTVQLVRQMVEQDHVFAIFDSLGTPPNIAIRPYLNDNKVPQLYVATGATQFGADYKQYPWTIGWQANYHDEATIFAKYLLKTTPNAKIGVLYQNDDFGEDLLDGLKSGLGAKANQIVKEASYEVTDPDVTSQIASLKASGADTVFIFATPKFAIGAMVTIAKMSWKPVVYLNSVSNAIPFMQAATSAGGPAATNGVISAIYLKDPTDPGYANDPGVKLYRAILAKYSPGANAADADYLYGMAVAFTMVDTLKMAGKDLTREGVMRAATHLHETDNPFVFPGILVSTTPTDRFPIRQEALIRYENGAWKRFTGLFSNRY